MSPIPVSQKEAQERNSVGVRLLIKGRIPSKKNSRNIFVRGGRVMNIPSSKYAAWHKDALEQLSPWNEDPIEAVSEIELSFWAPDKRSADLTNKAESVMDLLVDRGVLRDDNWWVVDSIRMLFRGVDRKNPRCEVLIHRK